MRLLEPLALGRRTARSRVVFGPHETNLARRRAVSDRHAAYYRRRAQGGAGVIVVETASVHHSDWPYERAPLASDCAAGWRGVKDACGADVVVVASLGHAGGQGSSAYNQLPLWAPSRVPDVATREVPKEMEPDDIAAVVEGFEDAARLAVRTSGLDGVEINAGQWSLVRQFLSGLTNLRGDEWGTDRLRFARDVVTAVRCGAGADAVVGVRLSCDELAPWAGITPAMAVELAPALVDGIGVDYVTVVRGSIFSTSATRPDTHVEPGFNLDLARSIRDVLPAHIAVIAQGSIVDPGQAEWALGEGVCDAVEMTRAQIADPELVRKVERGESERIRPCILCNQTCQVRDARNPLVSCVVEPSAGHELDDPDWYTRAASPTDVLVVGGGVAGMECARVAATRGHRVTLVERTGRLGGMVRVAANGAGRGPLARYVDWLDAELSRLGVKVEYGREVTADEVASFDGHVVLCTGSWPGRRTYEVADGARVLAAADVLADRDVVAEGAVAVWDPVGGPIGISVAELLRVVGRDVTLVTPDLIPGNELSRTGDLAPANTRLQSAGVVLEKRSLLRRVEPGAIVVEDRFTGERRTLPVDALIDAGHRLPNDALWRATGAHVTRAGDAVAPRTICEATLEGRRAAP